MLSHQLLVFIKLIDSDRHETNEIFFRLKNYGEKVQSTRISNESNRNEL